MDSPKDKKTILVVEDEPDVRSGLETVLTAEGFHVKSAVDGPSGLELALGEPPPHLIILDLMIPGLSGFEVCRSLRRKGSTTPVLILSARSSEVDKVLGLELGADDYVTKPFGLRELVARVRALLRRSDQPVECGDVETIGDAVIDFRRCRIQREGATLELYHFELEILKFLLANEAEVVAREDILVHVWGQARPSTRTVDFHVCNLRKKIEQDPANPKHLLTAHRIGYRLVR